MTPLCLRRGFWRSNIMFINRGIGAECSLLARCQTSAVWLADRHNSGCWLARDWQLAYFRVCYLGCYLQRPPVWCVRVWWHPDTDTDMCITGDQNNLNGFKFTRLSTSLQARITALPSPALRPVITNHTQPVMTECELLTEEFEMYLLDNQ